MANPDRKSVHFPPPSPARRRLLRASALALGAGMTVPGVASAAPAAAPHEVIRIERSTGRPYALVEAAFLAQLGPANALQLVGAAGRGALLPPIQDLLASEPGSTGFELFFAAPVGLFGAVKGTPRHATQFLVGNPFVAQKMLGHDVRIVQYFPFRVLVSEQEGTTSIAYDLPSSQVAWLASGPVTQIAQTVDARLASIVMTAVG